MANEVANYPLFLKPQDIQDATQFGKTTVYELIKEMEKVPGIVYRHSESKGIRIHRDKFFNWFASRSGMHVPEELQHA